FSQIAPREGLTPTLADPHPLRSTRPPPRNDLRTLSGRSPGNVFASTLQRLVLFAAEDSPSGLGRTLGKRVGGNPSRVRISYPPPLLSPGNTSKAPAARCGGLRRCLGPRCSGPCPRPQGRSV